MKTKEELLAYAIKMKKRGDTFVDIRNYLNRNCDKEDLINGIIKTVDKLENENQIKIADDRKSDKSVLNLIIGGILILGGIVMVFFLWGQGFVSTIPFILIGIGILALTGAIK
jgi:hypothetical protein